jgi:hypothetical protein
VFAKKIYSVMIIPYGGIMNRYQMRALARANRKRGQGYTRKKTMSNSSSTKTPETAAFLKAADEFLKSVKELSKEADKLDVIDSTELQAVEPSLELIEHQDEIILDLDEQQDEDTQEPIVDLQEHVESGFDLESVLTLPVREYIAEINSGVYDQYLDDLISLEQGGKSRVTVLKALNSRK